MSGHVEHRWEQLKSSCALIRTQFNYYYSQAVVFFKVAQLYWSFGDGLTKEGVSGDLKPLRNRRVFCWGWRR